MNKINHFFLIIKMGFKKMELTDYLQKKIYERLSVYCPGVE